MSLEHHVTSLELSRQLKELGVPQESEYWWATQTEVATGKVEGPFPEHSYGFFLGWGEPDRFKRKRLCSAFLTSELGERLPFNVSIGKDENGGWHAGPCTDSEFPSCDDYDHQDYGGCYVEDAGTMADTFAQLLIHLIEQGIVDPKKLGS